MQVKLKKQGGMGKAMLEGELTIYSAKEVFDELSKHMTELANIELNMQGVTELDTAGVQALLSIKRAAVAQNKTLTLCMHSEPVVEVFELINIAHEFGDPIVLSERATNQ